MNYINARMNIFLLYENLLLDIFVSISQKKFQKVRDMVTVRRKIEFDLYIISLLSNSGVSAASRKELEGIEKQRAGSIGSIDHEIRKIKTELYHDNLRQKEITYLERKPSEQQQIRAISSGTSCGGSATGKRKPVKKRRLNTKDAAQMERQRLVYIVGQIKNIPLYEEEQSSATSSID